ncbi:MAG: FKBP-type peptidyl-prolyl cis-trans isomerase, partial [Verrucomicrobia bacterium]|nr:FKBP-type peptidyl-prolyl cis-trans isomerase [Verrucomicrobiota bacterium]
SPHWFSKLMDNHPVLVEILLGHGRQNAIVHGRIQYLQDPLSLGSQDEFPFVSKKLSKTWTASANKYQKSPSFGFHTVMEEENALAKYVVMSDKLKGLNAFESRSFYCLPGIEETKSLVLSYEKGRAAIAKALAKKDFLEETLKKFFTTTTRGIVTPVVPKIRDLSLPTNKVETIVRLAEIIHKKIGMEPYAAQKFQNAFMQGVIAREKRKQMPVPLALRRTSDIPTLERELECCKNLERANAYFTKLSERTDLTALVPNELYMKVLKAGKDKTATAKTNKVSFQYTYQILGDESSRDWGIVKNENLAALIPGVAQAIIGMQLGEERVIYIHPKHAYGECTFFPPNASVVTQIRLLEFEEGENNLALLPPHTIEQRDYRELLTKFEVLRGEEFFDQGIEFWDEIKKGNDYIDFDTFREVFLKQAGGAPTTLNEMTSEQFILDLAYLLMTLQTPV